MRGQPGSCPVPAHLSNTPRLVLANIKAPTLLFPLPPPSLSSSSSPTLVRSRNTASVRLDSIQLQLVSPSAACLPFASPFPQLRCLRSSPRPLQTNQLAHTPRLLTVFRCFNSSTPTTHISNLPIMTEPLSKVDSAVQGLSSSPPKEKGHRRASSSAAGVMNINDLGKRHFQRYPAFFCETGCHPKLPGLYLISH